MENSPTVYSNEKKRFVPAIKSEVENYMNPNNFVNDPIKKYQFLDLSTSAGISEKDMKDYLKDKGILAGKEKVFLAAAKKYNINEVYPAFHACLETGNGTSLLAKGVDYKGVKVYDMFGIGAYDLNPLESSAAFAYKMGWISIDNTIEGEAKFISEQDI